MGKSTSPERADTQSTYKLYVIIENSFGDLKYYKNTFTFLKYKILFFMNFF